MLMIYTQFRGFNSNLKIIIRLVTILYGFKEYCKKALVCKQFYGFNYNNNNNNHLKSELLEIELFWNLNFVLMLNWFVWYRTVYMNKINLALDNYNIWCAVKWNQSKKKKNSPAILVER